jgi:predicted membrane chloride channel (bestrophin family)
MIVSLFSIAVTLVLNWFTVLVKDVTVSLRPIISVVTVASALCNSAFVTNTLFAGPVSARV